MPPKKVRYRVWLRDPILNTWRCMSEELTNAEATQMVKWVNINWDVEKREVKDA